MTGSTPETRPLSQEPSLPENVERQTRQNLDALQNPMLVAQAESLALDANSPERTYEHLIDGQQRFLGGIQSAVDSFGPALHAMQPDIQSTLTELGLTGTQTQIEKIITALTTPVPAYGTQPTTRYLTSRNVTPGSSTDPLPGTLIMYSINPKELKRDADFLGNLAAKLPPDRRSPFLALQRMVQTYASNDASLMQSYANRHRGPDVQTSGINKMLRIGGVLVFGSMVVLTGVMSLARVVSKKSASVTDFTAPLIYAGITALIASSSLRMALFGSGRDASLREVDKALNSKTFKRAGVAYDIAGKPWAQTADTLRKNPDLAAFNPAAASVAEKESFAEQLMPQKKSPQQHDQLVALLDHPEDYESFRRLADVQDKDARQIITEYVELGCGRYYRDMDNVKNALRDATQTA